MSIKDITAIKRETEKGPDHDYNSITGVHNTSIAFLD
jgi:hypothetical protein